MTKDADIRVLGNYMFGFWDDTKATLEETLAFAKELNCEYANFYCTVAYPGSTLYTDMEKAGLIYLRTSMIIHRCQQLSNLFPLKQFQRRMS